MYGISLVSGLTTRCSGPGNRRKMQNGVVW